MPWRGLIYEFGCTPYRVRKWLAEFYDKITGARSLKERLEAELLRTVRSAHVEKVRSPRAARPPIVRLGGQAWLEWESESLGVARRLTWEGDAEKALEILRTLPDRVGAGTFWGAFRGDLREAKLWAEIERVIGAPDWVDLGTTDDGAIQLDQLDQPERDSWRRWQGTVEEAQQRIATLSDHAGATAFWAAFPDAREVRRPCTSTHSETSSK